MQSVGRMSKSSSLSESHSSCRSLCYTNTYLGKGDVGVLRGVQRIQGNVVSHDALNDATLLDLRIAEFFTLTQRIRLVLLRNASRWESQPHLHFLVLSNLGCRGNGARRLASRTSFGDLPRTASTHGPTQQTVEYMVSRTLGDYCRTNRWRRE